MKCLACAEKPGPVCLQCEAQLAFAPRKVIRRDLTGVAAVDYSTTAATLISAFKERSHTTLASGFARLMKSAIEQLAVSNTGQSQAILVPVPSHPEWVRGFSPAEVLTRQLAPRLGASWLKGLSLRANVRDQAGLEAGTRATNLVGAMTAKPWMTGRSVWIVDDLVTTGSTLLEARRALAEVGCVVTGFVTFAETLKKSDTR